MTRLSRKRQGLIMLSLCALFFFIGAVMAQAATYYVAKTGNDAETCATAQTIATPKKTIASGVACLNPGDTLYIRSGIWTEQIDVSAKTGTPGNYITMAAYPGETVTIDTDVYPFAIKGTFSSSNAYFIFDGFILDGTGTPYLPGSPLYWTIGGGSHHIIARNLEIKNWKGVGILVEGADNIQIINCNIHDQFSVSGLDGERWYGIYYHHATNGLIEGNNIHHNPGGGMQIYPGPVTNLVIRQNSVHHNNALASSSIGGMLLQGAVVGVEVYNNLVYSNGTAPTHGYAPGISVNVNANGTKVWNNTVYGNHGWGIQLQDPSTTNTVIQNNIVNGNSYGEISNSGRGTILDHNLTSNPNFVNADAYNFILQTSSPAIDAGVALSQVTTDIKKNPRPQGGAYDIGAYEGGGSSDSMPPVRPVGLSVQ